MRSNQFFDRMNEAGDAYIYYTSPVSGKEKYHIGTIETSEYTREKLKDKSTVFPSGLIEGEYVIAFCWDLDDFKKIHVPSVKTIVPLSTVLGNT